MAAWPGPLEPARRKALRGLKWVAKALLLALVAAVIGLLLSQLVSLKFELLRLPLERVGVVCALTLAVLYLVGRQRAWSAVRGGLWFTAVMVATALIVGLAAWILGQHLSAREEPVTRAGLWAGFAVGSVVTWISLTVGTLFAWRAYSGRARLLVTGLAVLGVMAIAAAVLTARDPRWQLDHEGQQIKARGLGKLDVLLVLDPHDPAGRKLIAEANEQRDALRSRPLDTPQFDIAFGLAVLKQPQDPPAPLYETLLSPSRRSSFLNTLGGVPPAAGPPAYGSYGRVLLDAVKSSGVSWREASRRAVVFVTAQPPTEDELPDFPAALEAHRSVRADASSPADGPRASLAMYMVAPGADPAAGDWRRWTQATGGRLIDETAYEQPSTLRAIEHALTDSPVTSARALAEEYRPYVSLAKKETTHPVDVEALLKQAPKTEPDRVCDRRRIETDDCVNITSAAGLLLGPDGSLREQDEYIDFEDDVREAFYGRGPDVRTRMYFHLLRRDGLLHIGYWWYFPVNVSPVQVNQTCLPGLTVKEFTCYDHEGDWEGVTVTLEPRSPETTPSGDPYNPAAFEAGAWRPRSVTYDAHGRGIRWPWRRLRGTPAVDDSTHPVVYSASGSHASYPLPCPRECTQRLARRGLPEGEFDGNEETRIRCDECLTPMPALRRQMPFTRPAERDEDPVLWNAFPGRWGAALCLPIAQICSQSDGPRTPSRQDRYRRPWEALEPGDRAIRRFERSSTASARR